jgi:succinoglycan biosynthesis protein ExoV
MKLFYHHDAVGNFGDDLNGWLWPKLVPELLDDDDSTLFIGIGSILDERIPDGPRKVVFGTGIGYGRLPAVDERWNICCVRGPLTAAALGLPSHLAITDPAVLVSTVMPTTHGKTHRVSFMPHHRTKIRASEQGIDLRVICEAAGVRYIDPADEIEKVLTNIQGSSVTLAEAMHGAIIADALRVPWMPVQLFDHIRDLKWRDWCGSLGIEYEPHVYSQASYSADSLARFLKEVTESVAPKLSQPEVLESAIGRLQERLDALRSGHVQECCVTGGPHLVPDPEVIKSIPWYYDVQRALQEISTVVGPGETFILVDEGQWGETRLIPGRRSIPFLEKEGHYWGLPSDDEQAISELERLRAEGARYIAFAWSSFWWLDFYTGFRDYLRSHFAPVLESERLIVWILD